MPDLHQSARKHYHRDRLEPLALIYDDGYELVIHAMKARSQYLDEI